MKLKKSITLLVTMITMLLSTLLISCSEKHDEPIDNTKVYNIGMSEIGMSDGEWEVVFAAYKKELGYKESTFELPGNDIAANDAIVQSKCELAKKSLEGRTFEGYCTIVVNRGTHKIHSAQYGVKK